jgi:NADH-quinone oxidoreductase subunit G
MGAWDMGVTARDIGQLTLAPARSAGVGGIRATWIAGADPVGDGLISAADLRQMGFVVVQELFLTETAQAADVVLPAAAWSEREGSYTNGERRVQRFYAGNTLKGRPDFELASEIGKRLGVSVPQFAGQIMLEISKSVPAYAGVNYQALSQVVEQWPDVGGRDLYYGGTSYTNSQGVGVQLTSGAERGESVAASVIQPGRSKPEASGLTLVPTTVLYDRGATFVRSLVMQPRIPHPYVDINAADAARLNVANGATVTLAAGDWQASATARVDGRAPEGVILMPASLGNPVPPRATPVTLTVQPKQAAQNEREAVHAN